MAIERVKFEADGREHVLRLTTAAGARFEEAMGKPIGALFDDFARGGFGFRLVLAFFMAALKDGQGVSEVVAGKVIDDLGGLAAAADPMGEALVAAFPTADSDGEGISGNDPAG